MNPLRPAFTLIEMVIALTVFSIFLTLILVSYMNAHEVFLDLNDARSLYSDAEIFMNDVTERLRTDPVEIEGNILRFEDGFYTWDPLSETLNWQAEGAVPESVFREPIQVRDFSVQWLSDGVTNAQFPALLRAEFTLARPARSRPELTIHLKTALTPRYAIQKP